MVAPSFQSMTIMSEVYTKNNKTYINVKNEKTGTIRSVRWYTEQEYKKAYPNSAAAASASGFSGLKEARGFSNGPIAVLRGTAKTAEADNVWFSCSKARYATDVGWYLASTDLPAANVPSSISGIYLSWDEIKDGDDRHVKSPTVIKSLITEKFRNNRDMIKFF